ncbi:MAG TPA: bifunctional 4-hydroxy-2-oxoglutarate aldolase/2-dehydro-3-deoxy-phosphogluconate aldolase [Firmicutes bacterium]|nr:bifunctional 4-hydroxy-2-oxoglutarate aldolase/2-dehydro-3-deoxy-phosphogluconate aldolase [Bacillota bacterium]
MGKHEQLKAIADSGVVAVIRTKNADELVNICQAMAKGGVVGVEITMTSPGAVEAIKEASKVLGSKAIIGAGSVLDAETARMCILAGADFVVSPVFDPAIVEMCRRYSKIAIPGAFTPTEILRAWQAGADVVKVFPATAVGPSYLKDILGPMPQVKLTPTGGINLENLGDFIRAGAVFVGAGSSLVDKKLVAEGRWDELAERAAQFVAAAQAARAAV